MYTDTHTYMYIYARQTISDVRLNELTRVFNHINKSLDAVAGHRPITSHK